MIRNVGEYYEVSLRPSKNQKLCFFDNFAVLKEVRDICSGQLTFREGGEKTLPAGLGAYYNDVLDRLGISDESSLLTRVLCHLAVARTPLTHRTLMRVMCDDPLVKQAGSWDLVRRTMEFGHVLIRSMPVVQDGVTATSYALYHESFRDHLLAQGSTVKINVQTARCAFVRRACEWATWQDDPFSADYILRHGPSHLQDAHENVAAPAGESHAGWTRESLRATLCNPAFLEAKVEKGMGYEVGADYALNSDASDWNKQGKNVRDFARAFHQEFHAFQKYPDTTAQQLTNNLIAQNGQDHETAAWSSRSMAESSKSWFRRLSRAIIERPSRALQSVFSGSASPITAVAISPRGAISPPAMWRTSNAAARPRERSDFPHPRGPVTIIGNRQLSRTLIDRGKTVFPRWRVGRMSWKNFRRDRTRLPGFVSHRKMFSLPGNLQLIPARFERRMQSNREGNSDVTRPHPASFL